MGAGRPVEDRRQLQPMEGWLLSDRVCKLLQKAGNNVFRALSYVTQEIQCCVYGLTLFTCSVIYFLVIKVRFPCPFSCPANLVTVTRYRKTQGECLGEDPEQVRRNLCGTLPSWVRQMVCPALESVTKSSLQCYFLIS